MLSCAQADDKKLDEGVIPKSYSNVLTKGKECCAKLFKNAGALIKENPRDEKVLALKDKYSVITTYLSTIDHILSLEELPPSHGPTTKNNMENFLKNLAQNVEHFQREIAAAKGWTAAITM